MAVPLFGPRTRFFDAAGAPLSGGRVFTYEAGTTTPKDTYTTSAGTVANANPVILDSQGYADIWLGDGNYKIELRTSDGSTLWTVDNFAGDATGALGGNVYAISSTTSILASYEKGLLACTGTISLNLLAAATAREGFTFVVHNNGTGIVTVDPNGSETINGAANMTLFPGEGVFVVCDGTGWYGVFRGSRSVTSTRSTTYTADLSDRGGTILCNAASAGFTVNLPAAATVGNGFEVTVKKTDSSANAVTIDGNASETIDGATTVAITNQFGARTLVCDGTNWSIKADRFIFPGALVGFQVLTAASGTYTPTTGATRGIAIAIGGGGGSGAADGVNTSASGAGGGGGGGGAAMAMFTISGTVAFTVGAGGTAGADPGGNGGNGGTTTFTGIAVATGGSGGTGSGNGGSAKGVATGGAGGTGTTGALQLAGSDGGPGMWNYSSGEQRGGIGGVAPFGGGGGAGGQLNVTGTTATLAAGTAGKNYGGGAGGAANHSSTPGQAGAAGAQGVIYVLEYA